MEFIDVLDENGIRTNEIKSIDEVHCLGLCHRAIQVVLIDFNNNILIQQRSSNKSFFPNCWDLTVTGHVSAGELSTQTAIREIKEEVGLIFNLNDLNFVFSFKDVIKNGNKVENLFFDIFYIKKDYNFNEIKINTDEVIDYKLTNIDYVKKLYNQNCLLKNRETKQIIQFLEEKICVN